MHAQPALLLLAISQNETLAAAAALLAALLAVVALVRRARRRRPAPVPKDVPAARAERPARTAPPPPAEPAPRPSAPPPLAAPFKTREEREAEEERKREAYRAKKEAERKEKEERARERQEAEARARAEAEARAKEAEEARRRLLEEERRREEAEAGKTLAAGLEKTRGGFMARLNALFLGDRPVDDAVLADLEEVLFTADIGVKTATRLLESARGKVLRKELKDPEKLKDALREEIAAILALGGTGPADALPLTVGAERPWVVMVVGVNGSGKTTTVGKLAAQLKKAGHKVLIAAGDTFRAAAGEQLEIWAARVGAPVVRGKEGSDPAAVCYEAVQQGIESGVDVVLCDTAGRLHTKTPLMDELRKVKRVIGKAAPGAPHEVLLVLDATNGQNAIAQARQFNEALGVTGIALAKLDGTAKGGVVIGICDELKIPVRYVGVGETVADLRPFSPAEFVEALFRVTRYRLVLLDVDGTLVECGGAGRRALERAIRKTCGRLDGDLSALRLDGSTDRRIVRHALELLGHPYSAALCDTLLTEYPPLLEAELSAPAAYRVLPGVVALLEALRARQVAHGLCTGNVVEGARLKLRRGGLERYFEWGDLAVGGFGNDDEVRARVVEAALRRAAARFGRVAPAEVLVVGDTPLDVEAARRTGCASLAVATGRYLLAELKACGADHVAETLAAPEALEALSG